MRAYISGRYEGDADEIYISEAFFTGENEYEEDWPYDEGKHLFACVWGEFSTDPDEKTFAGRWQDRKIYFDFMRCKARSLRY